ncbi:MAG: hypothetical protein ISS79_08925 [Phycisphaerae bacterium]|nr:hypothetical protein [Phycisphaerae bacterium]
MTDSSKSRLMAAFVLATICLPAAAKDQNHPTTRLRFEVEQRIVDWRSTTAYGSSSRVSIKEGLVRPSHRAQLFIANLPSRKMSTRGDILYVDFQESQAIKKILNTPAGQKISPAQREFLEAGRAIYRDGSLGDQVVDHFRLWIYAVSKDDVEKTTQALIQFLTAEAEAKIRLWLSECKKLTEDSIPGYKKRVSEAEGEIKAVQTKLDTLKKTVHYVSIEEAMQTVLEFNKTLNTLEVEIAGLQAKVSANKEYMAHANLTNDALTKLQQILADHIIELAGALAKKETATKIRDQAKEFYDLHTQLTKLPKTLTNLRKSLSSHESSLQGAENAMTDPRGGALAPKVFGNKVVINPVYTD